MEERKQKILKRLKQRNKALDDFNIEDALDRAIDYFYSFCNRFDIPESADFIIYDMALFLVESKGDLGAVSSITRGDTSITYKSQGETAGNGLNIFNDFDKRLMRFKKIELVKKV